MEHPDPADDFGNSCNAVLMISACIGLLLFAAAIVVVMIDVGVTIMQWYFG